MLQSRERESVVWCEHVRRGGSVQLNSIVGQPAMLFLSRKRRVAAIYCGCLCDDLTKVSSLYAVSRCRQRVAPRAQLPRQQKEQRASGSRSERTQNLRDLPPHHRNRKGNEMYTEVRSARLSFASCDLGLTDSVIVAGAVSTRALADTWDERDCYGVRDTVMLEDFRSETAFLKNLEVRFQKDLIYVSTQHRLAQSDIRNSCVVRSPDIYWVCLHLGQPIRRYR